MLYRIVLLGRVSTRLGAALVNEVATLETEATAPKPDHGKIRAALNAIKKHGGKVADKVISYGIEKAIDAFMSGNLPPGIG